MQQLLTAVNLAAAAGEGYLAVGRISQENYHSAIGSVELMLLHLAILGLSEASAVEKYSEYKKIKQALTRHGWDERIIEPKSHSWCQRNATRVAAIDTGYRREINQYYKEQGHKWYHIFPNIKR